MTNKKPELSDLIKKFDINNLMGSLKSLINPTGGVPEVDPSDAIGLKIAQMSVISQQLAKLSEEQAKEFNRFNTLLNGLYQDIERLRHPEETPGSKTVETTVTTPETTVKSVTSDDTITSTSVESNVPKDEQPAEHSAINEPEKKE